MQYIKIINELLFRKHHYRIKTTNGKKIFEFLKAR